MNVRAWLRRAGRLVSEAAAAGGGAAATAYGTNPSMSAEQLGSVAAAGAAVYVIGALRRSFLPSRGGQPASAG